MFASFRVLKSWSHPASSLQPTVPDDFPVYDSGGGGDLIIITPYRISQWWTNLIVQEPRGRTRILPSDSSGFYALGFPKVFLLPPTGWSPHTYFGRKVLVPPSVSRLYVGIYVPSKRPCVKPSLEWHIHLLLAPSEQNWLFHSKILFDLSRRDKPHVRWHIVALVI